MRVVGALRVVRMVTALRAVAVALLAVGVVGFVAPVAHAQTLSQAPGVYAPPRPVVVHRRPVRTAADPVAAPDPAVRSGVLANGMRYLVMRSANPVHGLSVRFYFRAGSAEETEAERGGAHLLEHMAFEGTRRFPGDALDRAFQEAGVSLGRDQNAFTDVSGVDYVLDLQEAQDRGDGAGKLDLALTWLRDVADGLSLDPAAVERQKLVVAAEYNARRNGSSELGEIIGKFMGPDLLGARRSPGGSLESIAALNAPTLRAFHDRWYRPERTVLIVVGDFDPEVVTAKIAREFDSWSPVGEPVAEADRGGVDARRPESLLSVSIPNFAQGLVEVCSAAGRDPPAPVTASSWLKDGADVIWMTALQDRLTHLSLAPDAPFLSARIGRQESYRTAAYTCVSAVPKPEQWRAALQVIRDETRRLNDYGVTAAEADRGRIALAAALDAAASAGPTRRTEQLASTLLAFAMDGRAPVSPAEQRRTFALAEPELTAEVASEAFRRRWGTSQPLVILATTVPATQADLRAAWSVAKAAPAPAAPRDEPQTPWAYASFGAPGQVVERQVMNDPDFVRLRFANGVKLNFKQAAFTQDRVDLRVRLGAGQEEIAASDLAAALLGARSFTEGGLGAHDAEAISRIFRGKVVGVEFAVERNRFTLAGATRPQDFEAEAQLLTAYLVDPGFRPDVDLQVPAFAKLYFKSRAVEPALAARAALDDIALRPHVFDPPPEPEFAALRSNDFRRALTDALSKDALEVTVVGDIDEATLVRVIAATFGALPPRDDSDHIRADAAMVRYPDQAPAAPLRVRHEGLDSKALVYAVWPLFPWEAKRQLEIRQLTLLREVIGDEMRREIRERLGQTYTPQVSLEIPYGGDQCSMVVTVETNPATADAVAATIQSIAQTLAAGGVSSDVLERVRKPLLDDTARRKETNAWWVQTLDGSWTEPYKLAQARTWRYDYATISVDEVQQVATRWLAQRPLVAIALPRGFAEPALTQVAVTAHPVDTH